MQAEQEYNEAMLDAQEDPSGIPSGSSGLESGLEAGGPAGVDDAVGGGLSAEVSSYAAPSPGIDDPSLHQGHDELELPSQDASGAAATDAQDAGASSPSAEEPAPSEPAASTSHRASSGTTTGSGTGRGAQKGANSAQASEHGSTIDAKEASSGPASASKRSGAAAQVTSKPASAKKPSTPPEPEPVAPEVQAMIDSIPAAHARPRQNPHVGVSLRSGPWMLPQDHPDAWVHLAPAPAPLSPACPQPSTRALPAAWPCSAVSGRDAPACHHAHTPMGMRLPEAEASHMTTSPARPQVHVPSQLRILGRAHRGRHALADGPAAQQREAQRAQLWLWQHRPLGVAGKGASAAQLGCHTSTRGGAGRSVLSVPYMAWERVWRDLSPRGRLAGCASFIPAPRSLGL